jgi:hypothetical protein
MCILEHELLVKAKNGGDWDRYYNESLGDPRYVDVSGENNPMWKGGITYDPVAYMKAYRQTPERREVDKSYHKKYDAERYARKKAGTQGVGTLEGFI